MAVILFMGGWNVPFGLEGDIINAVPGVIWFGMKTFAILFFFIWTRASLPRYRYDQLMRLGWKIFLPFTLIWVVVISGTLLYLDAFPK
jgi:NADH-quinone oxidoreductase subunit H